MIRIALRLLLTESPAQRRSRANGVEDTFRNGRKPGNYGGGSKTSRNHFEDVEDAEFEEIPKEAPDKKSDDKAEKST